MAFEEFPVEDMDWDYHVQEEDAAEQWSDEKFNKFLCSQNEVHKPLDRPQWRMHLIPSMASGASMLVLNVDHAVTDGFALVDLLTLLMDGAVSPAARASARERALAAARARGAFLLRAYAFFSGLAALILTGFGLAVPADPPSCLRLRSARQSCKHREIARAPRIPLARVREVARRLGGATVDEVLGATLSLAINGSAAPPACPACARARRAR
jgi:hypothetical protein